MFELKKLTERGIERALGKVERYRLLNEPAEAESICRDVLEADPDNQEALVSLLLSLTDQFEMDGHATPAEAQALVPLLEGEYAQAYYSGIVCERRATALLRRGRPGSGGVVYDWYRQAMEHYERAERLRPEGNDDPLVRWNTCVRTIERHRLRPAPATLEATFLE
jgi:tetratricopeptide (TPR) repeat protein